MSKLILMVSAAAMAFSVPALAQGNGKGKGASGRSQQSTMQRSPRSQGQAREVVRARTDARSNARATTRTGAAIDRRADSNANGIPDYREQRLADSNGNGIPDYRERRIVDVNGNGIADYRERLIDRDRDRDGIDDRMGRQYGGAACPPGLAKKSPSCLPPGQASRMFREGQRLPTGYNYYTDYNRIPEQYRTQVPYLDANRYIYRDNSVYVVDPRTRMVTQVIDLLR
jgi:hypothetical protein